MASRLQLNGWRRLWLAASAGLAIWFVVVWPLQYLKDMRPTDMNTTVASKLTSKADDA